MHHSIQADRKDQLRRHIKPFASLIVLFVGTTWGCDEKTEAEIVADEKETREEMLEEIREDAPDSAAEMKEEVGVESMDEERAQTPEELREKLDIEKEE